jgi:hypothetical protein
MKHAHHAGSREPKPKAQAKSAPAAEEPTDLDGDRDLHIREAAYFRYLARGAEVGHDLEDWLQAESELLEAGDREGASH